MLPSKDKKRSVEKALTLLSMAAKNGANIVGFPELFTTGWFPQYKDNIEGNRHLAETLDGETITLLKENAAKFGIVLIVPFFELFDGNYFNSCAVIDADGVVLGAYRQIHLPEIEFYHERSYFSAGDNIPVFNTKFGTIGVVMCWDNFYPEVSRILAIKGAKIIFAPTASAFNTNNKWFLAISANAFTNGVYILRINRVGKDGDLDFYGKSFCIAPDGSLVDNFAGLNECALIYNLETNEINRARKAWPLIENRIAEVYKDILQK